MTSTSDHFIPASLILTPFALLIRISPNSQAECQDAGTQITGWDQVLGRATRAINTRRIVALGYTPFELLFGVHPRLPFEYTYPKEELSKLQARSTRHNNSDIQELHGKDWEEAVLGRSIELKEMRSQMLREWTIRNAQMIESYDSKIKRSMTFKPGDLVMLYDHTVGPKGTGKLAVQWPGPYQVIGMGGEHGKSYHLKHIHEGNVPGTHHGDHLKLYKGRPGRLRQPFDDEPHIGPEAIRNLRRRRVPRMLQAGKTMFLVNGEEDPTGSLGLNSFEEFWKGIQN